MPFGFSNRRLVVASLALSAFALLGACSSDDTSSPSTGGKGGSSGKGGSGGTAASAGKGGSGGTAASGGSGGGSGGSGGASGGASGSGGSPGGKYPLTASSNRRYLVQNDGAPFLLAGDAPQGMIANLAPAEMATYFTQRAGQGFNAAWVNLLCNDYTGGRPDGTTYDGIEPFTAKLGSGTYDLTQPNPDYFTRVDAALTAAAQNGIVVFLDPAETGGFLQTLRDNGVDSARKYGQFLGTRYVNQDNIVWMSGNDFQSWQDANDDAVVRAVAQGIQDNDTRHLQTTELSYNVSSSLDDATWESLLGMNLAYTYAPVYAEIYKDYNRVNHLPTAMIEANYEGESLAGAPHTTDAHDCRTQFYWSNTSGASGSFYGNHDVWPLDSSWQAHMTDPGAAQMIFVGQLFAKRAWFDLVPDQQNQVVISGFGTYSDSGNAQDNDYATTARTSNGSLVVSYMPNARDVVVDMTKLAAPAQASWFDPTTGALTPISGSPFANSGTHTFSPPTTKHADSFDDWVLVIETNPPP